MYGREPAHRCYVVCCSKQCGVQEAKCITELHQQLPSVQVCIMIVPCRLYVQDGNRDCVDRAITAANRTGTPHSDPLIVIPS
jgi:hypothetical protein